MENRPSKTHRHSPRRGLRRVSRTADHSTRAGSTIGSPAYVGRFEQSTYVGRLRAPPFIFDDQPRAVSSRPRSGVPEEVPRTHSNTIGRRHRATRRGRGGCATFVSGAFETRRARRDRETRVAQCRVGRASAVFRLERFFPGLVVKSSGSIHSMSNLQATVALDAPVSFKPPCKSK